MEPRKTIAILGAGFGGLRAAKVLTRKLKALGLSPKYEIVLVDRNDHHTYTPLLYEVATTSKELATISDLHSVAAYNIRSLIEKTGLRFVQKEIEHIDPMQGSLKFADGEVIECHFIVLALGSETNYFDIPGLKEHALTFKTFEDAIRIRDAVWNRAMEKSGEIKIVVGGAGPTGVELAAEFKNWSSELEKEFKGCKLKVMLIEGMGKILSGLDPRIIERAEKRLKTLGVEVMTGKKIAKTEQNTVMLDTGDKIDFDMFIWTGGVKAHPLLSNNIQVEKQNRALVGAEMQCIPQTPNLKLSSKIYGLGDSICFYDPKTQKPLPGVARAAILQANVVVKNIVEEIRAMENPGYTPRPKTYRPKEYPYVVPVGGKFAAAKLGPVILSGFLGWILKGLVELNYLLSIMSPARAIRIWLKGFIIFARNKRLG